MAPSDTGSDTGTEAVPALVPVVLTHGEPGGPPVDDHGVEVLGHRPGHLPSRRRPRARQQDPAPVPRPAPPSGPFVIADTSYPWSAVGRVQASGGWSSGVLVGPRHLLTAAHVLTWVRLGAGGTAAAAVRFAPAAFDREEPFGSASAVAVYAVAPADAPTIDAVEERVDYAVCVLDRPIGEDTGWMGTRAYRDAWDGLPHWCMVGYRRDGGGVRPLYEEGIVLDGHDDQDDCHQVVHHAGDVQPGQSGGPVLGWWQGEDFPRVVAVQSWGWPGRAGASGGDRLVDLVVRARRDHP